MKKLDNFLLDPEFKLKLCDFNSSQQLSSFTDNVNSFPVTAEFSSPEYINQSQVVGLASDIWSFGCLIVELSTSTSLFKECSEFLSFEKIRNYKKLPPLNWINPDVEKLAEDILKVDPSSRPTSFELKVHPFFSDIEWENILNFESPLK